VTGYAVGTEAEVLFGNTCWRSGLYGASGPHSFVLI
jgi:hypothetical protein